MFAVLMAGGVGTRFWPMSRKAYPKQLLNFSGTKSMLQKTYAVLLVILATVVLPIRNQVLLKWSITWLLLIMRRTS